MKKEWQDIATAPKDGTLVDLWIPRTPQISEAHRSVECGYVNGKWTVCGAELGWLQSATHWMPLPDPPKETAK